jgi:hypothetical protein
MAALALVRPRWAAGSEQAIPVCLCRTFPDIRAVSAAAIGPLFLCQTPASTRKRAIPRESEPVMIVQLLPYLKQILILHLALIS